MNRDGRLARNLLRAILVILLAGVVIGGVFLVVRFQADYRASHVTLPDGRTLELLGTAAGGATFTTETKWQRLARRFLPSPFQKWIPTAATGNCSSGSSSLTVYVRIGRSASPVAGPQPWQSLEAEDESGFRYQSGGGSCRFGGSSGAWVEGLILRAYPRRQKVFLLHLVDPNGVDIATLHVQNPVTGPFPEWRASPMPQTRSNGPVALTLEHLEERDDPRWGPHVAPKWHLEADDPAWVNARVRYFTLLDATGNEGGFLSRREPVWKVRTQVFRERPEDFAASEQMVLTNLALPATGGFLAIDQSNDCAGVGIKALVLAGGPGRFGISNGVTRFMLPPASGTTGYSSSSGSDGQIESWGGSTPFLLIEARNVQNDDEIQFHIHDDAGQELKVTSNGYQGTSNGGGRMYQPAFTPPVGAKFITVQIIVNRPLVFEFLVNPADVPPPQGKSVLPIK